MRSRAYAHATLALAQTHIDICILQCCRLHTPRPALPRMAHLPTRPQCLPPRLSRSLAGAQLSSRSHAIFTATLEITAAPSAAVHPLPLTKGAPGQLDEEPRLHSEPRPNEALEAGKLDGGMRHGDT